MQLTAGGRVRAAGHSEACQLAVFSVNHYTRISFCSPPLRAAQNRFRAPRAGLSRTDRQKLNPSGANFFSRSHHAIIRVYDGAGNVIETHEQAGDFKEW
jgi:hypothetical protein